MTAKKSSPCGSRLMVLQRSQSLFNIRIPSQVQILFCRCPPALVSLSRKGLLNTS